ncbi:hypothetical protein [Reinekea sp. G2M2-21]|uniref:hypothetical protein n=1 Tax=Reinekea sp. G2M2-21 TaxID=2788942 RepID=UPI0018AB8816|nr:hypothetical protein [Reinekea sp. G2M2-21]
MKTVLEILESQLRTVHCEEDIQKAIDRIKNRMFHYRREAKKAAVLAKKLSLDAQGKQFEKALRKLRLSIFDVEDAIAAGKTGDALFDEVYG